MLRCDGYDVHSMLVANAERMRKADAELEAAKHELAAIDAKLNWKR